MTRPHLLLLLPCLLLTACKRGEVSDADRQQTIQTQAIRYVQIAQVAAVNAFAEQGQKALPPTPCDDPMFGLKPGRVFTVQSCTLKTDDRGQATVAATFKEGFAVLGDAQGVRVVPESDLPPLN